MAALISAGAILQRIVIAPGSAPNYTEVPATAAEIVGVTAMTVVSGLPEEIETTVLKTGLDDGRQYINGFQEDAVMNITFQFDGKVALHQALMADQAAQPIHPLTSKSLRRFVIKLPETGTSKFTTFTFRAYVRNLSVNLAVNAVQSATLDLVVRELPTVAYAQS